MVMAKGMPMAYAMGVPMTMCTGTSTIGKHASWGSQGGNILGKISLLAAPGGCPRTSWAPKRAFLGENGPFWRPQEFSRGL